MPNYSQPLEHGSFTRGSQANPAAGANFSRTLSSQFIHGIISISFTLVTDANAANRFFVLQFADTTTVFTSIVNQNAIVAGSTVICSATRGLANDIANNNAHRTMGLPVGLYLPPLSIISSLITNIQVGDQISNLQVAEQRWIP